MKKIAFVFFTVAAVMVLTACDRQSSFDENDVRLSLRSVWYGGYQAPEDQYNNPVAAAIREKTGVTVTIDGIMMDALEYINLMFASGDMPDIINTALWGGADGMTQVLKKAAAQGLLHPIQDMLEKYPNVKRSYDIGVISQSYLEQDLMDPAFDGNLYFIPNQTAGNADNLINWTPGIFVRGDVPQALGIDPASIKTQEDLYNFMVMARDYGFKDVNGNDVIVATTFQTGWDYNQYLTNFTDEKLTDFIRTEDGAITHRFLTQNYIDSNMFIWRLINEDLFDRECFRQTVTQAYTKMGNGTALFFGALYHAGIDATQQTGLYTAHPEMRYVPVGPLNYADGSPLTQIETVGRTGCPVLFFPKTNKHLDASFRYIDFINTIEGMTLAQYGIEGMTWEQNDQGQPRLIKDFLDRQAAGDISWQDEMRDVGAGYIANLMTYGSLFMEWFGEASPGAEEIAIPEHEAYKKMRPIKQIPGYPLRGSADFPEWDRVSSLFDGEMERVYRERAYFARTEAEARSILLDFQNYLRTQHNGVFMDWLEFMTQKANSRPDTAL